MQSCQLELMYKMVNSYVSEGVLLPNLFFSLISLNLQQIIHLHEIIISIYNNLPDVLT